MVYIYKETQKRLRKEVDSLIQYPNSDFLDYIWKVYKGKLYNFEELYKHHKEEVETLAFYFILREYYGIKFY